MHRDEHVVGLDVELAAFHSQGVVRETQLEVLAGVALQPQVREVLLAPAQKQLLRAQQIRVHNGSSSLKHSDSDVVGASIRVISSRQQVVCTLMENIDIACDRNSTTGLTSLALTLMPAPMSAFDAPAPY